MHITGVWILGVISLASSYAHKENALPDIENEDFIKDCVRMHNKFRSEVNPIASDMLYMSWDPALAQIAKTWAKECLFKHNPRLSQKLHTNFTPLGENIWTGSLSAFSVSSAITSWYSEVEYYDFEDRKCTRVCGHYTQVVWANSYKVGCAVQFCPRVSGFQYPNAAHFICNYGPAGNYPTRPYKKGAPCSACRKNDTCLDNLCTNPRRDKVTRYHPPDRPLYPRNKNLSLFLILSPPILLLSAIITIFIKQRYCH